MNRIYTCPSCSKGCSVDESLYGKDVLCPNCGRAFTATPPEPIIPDEALATLWNEYGTPMILFLRSMNQDNYLLAQTREDEVFLIQAVALKGLLRKYVRFTIQDRNGFVSQMVPRDLTEITEGSFYRRLPDISFPGRKRDVPSVDKSLWEPIPPTVMMTMALCAGSQRVIDDLTKLRQTAENRPHC